MKGGQFPVTPGRCGGWRHCASCKHVIYILYILSTIEVYFSNRNQGVKVIVGPAFFGGWFHFDIVINPLKFMEHYC